MEIQILDKSFKPFLSQKELLSRVFDISKQIERDYKNHVPIFIAVLNGSFMFVSDFFKNYTSPCEIEFIKLKSYIGTESSGHIEEVIGLSSSLTDRHIVILEDIIDTGNTMNILLETIQKQNPASIRLATLLFKPESFQMDFKIDYIGFEIPDNFIVGYGLDYNGQGRNLNEIYTIVS